MATGKRKSSSGRKTSGRKTNSGRKKNDIQQESFTEEVILWVILEISILLFISNFGIGGAIGNAVSSFFFGVFGLIAYIFPVVLVIGTFFAASNKGNRIATVKIAAAVFFVLFLCMFIEIVRCGAEVAGAAGAYQYCSVHKIGGGFLGGLLAGIFCPNFGLLGSYVIDVVAMIICLVLITERSALKGVQKGSRKVYETAKESNERHRELVEQRREERELRRMDRKVEGVAVDTRVLPDRKAEPMGSDEVSEINIDKLLEQSNTNLPEIKAEKHVTLTAGGAEYQKLPAMEPETEPYVAPSAFSKEAFEAKELEEDASIFHSEPAYQESIHTEPAYEEHHPVEESIPYDAAEKPKKNVKATEEDIQNDVSSIEEEIHLEAQKERKYVFPPVSLLKPPGNKQGDSKQHLQETAQKLQQTLKNFGVNVTITNISCGPSVTRYEIQPEMGVKVSKIVNLADDIKLNLAAADIRIEAPIPVIFHFLRCELTHYFCRVAKCHGIVRDYHFSSDKCAGSNDAVLSDHCAAQYNASHSHNGIISNRTAVHYRIVSDGHTFSDMDGMSLICMQCAVILHIGIVVNKNTSRIATHHCVIPDSYILS